MRKNILPYAALALILSACSSQMDGATETNPETTPVETTTSANTEASTEESTTKETDTPTAEDNTETTIETTEETTEVKNYNYYYPSEINLTDTVGNKTGSINLKYDDAAHITAAEYVYGDVSDKYTFKYDSKGRLIKESKNDIDILTNEYNDKDKVVDIKEYDDTGLLSSHTVEYYVEEIQSYPYKSKPLMTVQLNTDGSLAQTITYNYDDGDIIGVDYYDSNNTLTAITKLLDDQTIYYQMPASDSMSTNYTVDDEGRITSIISHTLNPMGGFNDSVRTYEYNEDNTYVVSNLTVNNVFSGSTEETFLYIDGQKYVTDHVEKDAAGVITSRTIRDIGTNGELSAETKYDYSPISESLYVSQLKLYDISGNPLFILTYDETGEMELQKQILYGKYNEQLCLITRADNYLSVEAYTDHDLTFVIHDIVKVETDENANIQYYLGSDSNIYFNYQGID